MSVISQKPLSAPITGQLPICFQPHQLSSNWPPAACQLPLLLCLRAHTSVRHLLAHVSAAPTPLTVPLKITVCSLASNSQTGQSDRMSRASVARFGRSGNPNLVGLNPGRVKSMTLKLIFPGLALGIIRIGQGLAGAVSG